MKKLLLLLCALTMSVGTIWADKTVYLNPGGFTDEHGKNWASDNAVFVAYVFDDAEPQNVSWIQMSTPVTIDGNTCYKAEIPDTWTSLILVRQDPNKAYNSWDSKWSQTNDIDFSSTADNTLFTITGWGNGTGGNSGHYTAAVNSYSASFATNKSWASVNAYAWSDEGSHTGNWPGAAMTDTGEDVYDLGTSTTYNIYSISFLATSAPDNIIFNNGDDPGVEGSTKTSDLPFTNGKLYLDGIIENLAYSKIATGSSTWADNNASYAVDGNNNTKWQAGQNNLDATLDINLGSSQSFNYLQIVWGDDVYSTQFKIFVSDDGTNWGDAVLTASNLGNMSGSMNVRGYVLPSVQTAQYVRLQTVSQNRNDYGIVVKEIKLANTSVTYSDLTLSANPLTMIVGETSALTVTKKDNLNGYYFVTDATFTRGTPAVGSITDNAFTAEAGGTTTLQAESSSLTSNTITLTVYEAVKIDLATHNEYRVYPIEETLNNGKSNAFDSDANSQWVLHEGTEADETSRTYNTGFIADLGGEYDIASISIKFEGACSQTFGLAFAGADGVFGENVYNGGHNATETHTENFSGESVLNARYVKFLSTKAQSQYGVKIMDFTVNGVNKSTVEDTTIPTITSVTNGTITNSSITLNITGNDNDSKYMYYEITGTTNTVKLFGAAGSVTSVTLSSLLPGKSYNLSVKAYDSKGNVSETTNHAVSTTGEALTLPVATKTDVVTIFGQYDNATGFNSWRATEFTEEGWSHAALQTNGANYNVEMTFTAVDVSGMEYLHIDFYAIEDITNMCVFTQDGAWKGKDIDGGITAGAWRGIDIPMSFFTTTCGRPMTALTNIIITKAVANPTTTHDGWNEYTSPYPYFLIGNIYFWKESAVDSESPVMTKVVASTVGYSTATLTVSATDDLSRSLTYIVKNGDTEVGRNTGNPGEDATVFVSGLTPETDYTLTVTATDAADHVSSGRDVSFTTTAGPDMYDDDVTIEDGLVAYHFELIQTGLNVTASFTKTNDVSAVAGQIRYIYNSTGGDQWINAATYTWENCTVGDQIEVQYWWDATGRKYSKTYTYTVLAPITIGSHGYTTYISDKDLDFTGVSGITAYRATRNGTTVTLNTVTEVPANKGLVIQGTAGKTYKIPKHASTPEDITSDLTGNPTSPYAVDQSTKFYYVLSYVNDVEGFYRYTGSGAIPAGKAFFETTEDLSALGANYLSIIYGDEEEPNETNGINAIEKSLQNGEAFNLAGQRVDAGYKGIVIINGKKYVRK
ncbi:MAG: discoidin domain-containing protein [Prevotella sp.]|nr:discoidin domain-containing protein [Prevotella sp.]